MTFNRKKLGRLGLVILEGFVGKQLGDGFVEELKSDYKVYENLIRALQNTEEIFRNTCQDQDFVRNIFDDLPITDLPSIQEAAQNYYSNPSDPTFSDSLKKSIVRDFRQFLPLDIDKYTAEYVSILTQQLVVLDEKFNVKINTLATLAGLNVAKETLKTLERVAENTKQNELLEFNNGGDIALGVYLDYVIQSYHLLKLQGIYLANDVVGIELEKVYIPQYVLSAKNQRQEAALINRLGNQIPGFSQPMEEDSESEIETVSMVAQALSQFQRLIVLGSPGVGKSTLLSFLALHHATNLHRHLKEKGPADNSVCLPVMCILRDLAKNLPINGMDGPDVILNFIHQNFSAQAVENFDEFFNNWLENKDLCCLFLFDGLDEVGDDKTRARIGRIIEKFTLRYPHNRFVVTSRVTGYRHSSRLGEGYKVVTLHPFNEDDVRKFIFNCNRQIELFLSNKDDQDTLSRADVQSNQLLNTVFSNPKLANLAFIPLLSMIILLVYRERGSLPDRRVKIYEAIVSVLLSQWDEAKGMQNSQNQDTYSIDSSDSLQILEKIAFSMHSEKKREISHKQLIDLLHRLFQDLGRTYEQAKFDTQEHIRLIQERTGLLQERGQGIYSFAHLSIQEYLAASALSSRDDISSIIQTNLVDSWWIEVVKMAIGIMESSKRTQLLEMILQSRQEVDQYDNLILTAECVADLGVTQIPNSLQVSLQERLLQAMVDTNVGLKRRVAAGDVLGCIADPRFRGKFLLSQFAKIVAGISVKGSQPQNLYAMENEIPQTSIEIPEFFISIFPVTNFQYQRFLFENIQASVPASDFYPVPDWDLNLRTCRPEKRNRPVVFVSKKDADQYCRWLTNCIETDKSLHPEIRNCIGKGYIIRLPTEAEWEKAARGQQGTEWTWGNSYRPHLANTDEEGLGDTTPVGIFREGANTQGVFDLPGNVFEWTSDHDFSDGICVLKGGSWIHDYTNARCPYRLFASSTNRTSYIGFRIVLGMPIRMIENE